MGARRSGDTQRVAEAVAVGASSGSATTKPPFGAIATSGWMPRAVGQGGREPTWNSAPEGEPALAVALAEYPSAG